MAIFISYPLSTRDIHISPRAEIIIYLSYIFLSDKFTYSISYGESKERSPSAPNVVIWVFCPSKKAISSL